MYVGATRRALALSVVLLAGACGGTGGGMRNESAGRPEARGNDEIMRDDTPAQSGTLLRVTLDAEPELHVGDEETFTVHVRVTNEGDQPVSADALVGQLRVDDDVAAVPLEVAGHGWVTLNPGETAEWDARPPRVRLLPGEHTLRLEIGEALSEPVRVRVTE